MINKIKMMYPGYIILIKKHNDLFDAETNNKTDPKILKKNPYIIVNDNSYEVHKKYTCLKRL